MTSLHEQRQGILDHCRSYFYNRYMRNNGKCTAGWGSASDPSDRCALASLVKESFEHQWQFKLAIAKMCQVSHTDNLVFPSTFYGLITRFNDNHSGQSPKSSLTIKEINDFLFSLAAKYDLEYEPLLEKQQVVAKRAHKYELA